MRKTSKVRFSRAGDQFHYFWAARRCLNLLLPSSNLVAVAIEGTSTKESGNSILLEAGEESIDIAEYYGSEDRTNAYLVRYLQLKHSTQACEEPWTPGGLKKTVGDFAKRFKDLLKEQDEEEVVRRFEFSFVSNRPISANVLNTIDDIRKGTPIRSQETLKKIKEYTGLRGEQLKSFCKCLTLDGGQPHYQMQRSELAQDTSSYLPDYDVDAPTKLKELVTRKALPESANDPCIRRTDVLRELGTGEDRLFPAPCLSEQMDGTVARWQESAVISEIIAAKGPVLIHATGGVGKSVFAQRISQQMPAGSVCIVYDCFGNGEYRQLSHPRHRHQEASVQISNELSALGLCSPLIPTKKADNQAYFRALIHRTSQAVDFIKRTDNEALVCIIIDAADNAEMAAQEFGEHHAFARDLLRESMPNSVRLVMLCRTERRALLNISPDVKQIELDPFNLDESGRFLRTKHSGATENDVNEFHRLTAGNPRVQANALSQFESLSDTLHSLGPAPITVESQLDNTFERLIDAAGPSGKQEIERICSGMAVLKPRVPLEILSKISGADVSAIKSFAADFGRPVLLAGETLQFRDEPVESWFRTRFRASTTQLSKFIEVLEPLAATYPYVASCLPYLLLESGQLTKLIEVALSGSGLPEDKPIDRREIELQRLQFALKASLRNSRYPDASKLALKAAEVTVGDARQQKLFQANTDLVAKLLDATNIEEIASRRPFEGEWMGARHVHEAALYSYIDELKGVARSRLRMAHEWLRNWSRLPKDATERNKLSDLHIAEMALAQLNLHGPAACAQKLRQWSPRIVSFSVGRIVARRLIDHERYADLEAISVEAGNDIFLIMAFALELRALHRILPVTVIERCIRILNRTSWQSQTQQFRSEGLLLQATVAIVESAYKFKIRTPDSLAKLIGRYLPNDPPRGLDLEYNQRRYSFLTAYCLRAALLRIDINLADCAYNELNKELKRKDSHGFSAEVQRLKQTVGAVLPWHRLRTRLFLSLDGNLDIGTELAAALKESNAAFNIGYRQVSDTRDEIALLWMDILLCSSGAAVASQDKFTSWVFNQENSLTTSTLNSLAHIAARSDCLRAKALGFAQEILNRTRDQKEDAESKASTYIESARALLSVNKEEAYQYFQMAIEVSGRLGDEVFERWDAMMDLADRAQDLTRSADKTAYRFARCAELAKEYIYDHFPWQDTVRALIGLSPRNGIAIVSRWRDRKFGWIKTLLPTVIRTLQRLNQISPQSASVFAAFSGEWDYQGLFEDSISQCQTVGEQQHLFDYLLSYFRKEEWSESHWTTLKDLAAKYGLEGFTCESFVEKQSRIEDHRNDGHKSEAAGIWLADRNSKVVDWTEFFALRDIYTREGLSKAFTDFETLDSFWDRDAFLSALFQRVETGRESEFLRGVLQLSNLSLYWYQDICKFVPKEWKTQMSVKSAISESVRSIYSRFCLDIVNSRRYSIFQVTEAATISGLSEEALVDIVLNALAQRTESFSSGRLFSLTGLLTRKLSQEEALEALDFGLTLFETELSEADGDGPWSVHLEPPTTVTEAISGFLWSALGAPQAAYRWEAAHAVRGLCSLNQTEIIDALIERAKENVVGPFADAELHFYSLHARLYLLIALARAAMDNPACLQKHVAFFHHYSLNDQPHVLIRHFASIVSLTLAKQGYGNNNPALLEQLASVNISPFKETSKQNRERLSATRTKKIKFESKRYHFNMDIESYWFSNLASCFGTNASEIAVIAESIICDEWGITDKGHYSGDARRAIGVYGERDSYHSHGSYPKVEDLDFYLSYHAMMIVAGRLLRTVPLHHERNDSENAFQGWLSEHLLTRSDGCWLSDRRDPSPCEVRDWKTQNPETMWRWSVASKDFETVLGMHTNCITVWGFWKEISGNQEETVQIESALVSPLRSRALLYALQTADSCHDYRIPDAGSDKEINDGAYVLRGWIDDRDCSYGLDEFDPWSGRIRYPALQPTQHVIDQMNLAHDVECRSWWVKDGNVADIIMRSQIWGEWQSKGDQEREHGRRLQVTSEFLETLLSKTGMDMIFKVRIKRDISRRSYEPRPKDEIEYVEPYCKLFLLGADGSYETV